MTTEPFVVKEVARKCKKCGMRLFKQGEFWYCVRVSCHFHTNAQQ